MLSIGNGLTAGNDEYGNEIRMAVHSWMRSKNSQDFGGLSVWRIKNYLFVRSGDGWVEFPIRHDSEAAAVLEMDRIIRELDELRRAKIEEIGDRLPDILRVKADELPAELLNAWVR